MALISSPVPNLVNGVSQQPPTYRDTSQGEVQENCVSSTSEGVVKRPPLEHLTDLVTATDPPAFTYFIPGDTRGEQLVVTISGSDVRVFDGDGDARTVAYTSNTAVLAARRPVPRTALASRASDSLRVLVPTDQPIITIRDSVVIELAGQMNIVWERSETGEFDGEQSVFRTRSYTLPTNDRFQVTNTEIDWVDAGFNGQYLRAVATRVGSGTATAAISAAVELSDSAYIRDQETPRDSLKATTVGDTTYILNTNVETGLKPDTKETFQFAVYAEEGIPSFLDYQAPPLPRESLIYIRSIPSSSPTAPYKFRFAVDQVGSIDTTTLTPTYSNNIATFRSNIVTAIQANSLVKDEFSVTQRDQVILLSKRARASDAFVTVAEDTREGDIFIIPNYIQSYADLPVVATSGFRVEVLGSADSDDDNYWVEFVSPTGSSGLSQGYWIESTSPYEVGCIDGATMPHALTRNEDGTFTFGQVAWEPRMAGDNLTNPPPSFLGNTINSIFQYSNRLGLLSGGNVIFSELDHPAAFYRSTVLSLLETAPIDVLVVSVSETGGSSNDLLHAADFNGSLLLLNGNAQAEIDGSVALSPRTIAAPSVSEFQVNPLAPPVSSGKDLYFSSNSGNFSVIREYFRDRDAETNDSVDVSSHVPKYVPKDIRKVVPLTTENTLVILSDDDPGSLYIHRFFWNGREKVQSSWSRWTFEDSTIRDISAVGSELFLLVEYSHSTSLHLEMMDLSSGAEDQYSTGRLYLDRRFTEAQAVEITHGTHGGQQATFITPPYAPDIDATYVLQTRPVSSGSFTPETFESIGFGIGNVDIIFPGQHASANFYVGQTYESLYEFSEFNLSVPQLGGQSLPVNSSRVTVRAITVAYNDTGEFDLEVTQGHTGRTSVYPVLSPGGPGTTTSGNKRAIVMSKPMGTRIVARNNSHRPFGLLSAEYSVEYTEIGRG